MANRIVVRKVKGKNNTNTNAVNEEESKAKVVENTQSAQGNDVTNRSVESQIAGSSQGSHRGRKGTWSQTSGNADIY